MSVTRVGFYARVSTSNHHQDPEMQLRDMRAYANSQGNWRVAEDGAYVDVGISGTKSKRPELDRLMADVRAGKLDVVMVWRFDRFARSVSHLLAFLEELNKLNVSFVSLNEKVDTTTPVGKMIFTVLGAVAELERSLIVERVRAGLRNTVAKGTKLGRPQHAIDPKLVAATVEAMGGSVRSAAAELKISYGLAYKLNHRVRRERYLS